MKPRITDEQQIALNEQHGVVEVQGDDGNYILMSLEVYREMMGVGSDAEMAESLKAIERGLADMDTGRTRPYRDVLNELGNEV